MILIVDDDESMTQTCSMLLEAHGFDVHVATSGLEALFMLRASSHELVISDCVMPGMTGLELSREIKADPSMATLPVLLMSASLRRDIASGASYEGFLRKPFLAESLLFEVRKLLQVIAPAPSAFAKV